MFRQNLLLTLRTFKKFKNSFLINLFGLSTGLACTLLIFLWVHDELNMNGFHAKSERLYQVLEHQQYADDIMTTTSTPGPLADGLAEEIPEVEYAATTTWVNPFTLSIGDHNIKAEGFFVGKEFFNIFSYGLYEGNPDKVLEDKKGIVISKELAQRLFDTTENIVGRMVEYQHEREFQVTGVFEGTPAQSSAQFDFVLSFEVFKEENQWVESWGNNGPSTYVVLTEGSKPKEVSAKIANFIKDRDEESHVTLLLQKYADRYLHGRWENGEQSGGRIEYVELFSIIAIFILVIACINFMNLSTARASRRMKEVGIKKAIGAQKSSLVTQFLSESLFMSLFALLLAIGIVYLFLPEFNNITEKSITLTFNWEMTLAFISIAVITGLIAGSYPALYLSGFNPVSILKGTVKGSIGELWARRGLVVVQFFLSVVLVVSVLVIYQQISFVQGKNLGYEKENVISFPMEGRVTEQSETFLTELKQIPGVVNASTIGHSMIGRNSNTSGVEWDGKNPDDRILFENMRMHYGLIETMGMEIVAGRTYSKDYGSDSSKIIFNEAAIRIMGYEDNPVGRTVKLWDDEREIIGVVKDFHFQSLHDDVNPLFIILEPEITWNVMVRLDAGNPSQTIADIEDFYTTYNPGFTLDYQFLDEQYARQYSAEQRVAVLSRYFAGFAIIISCLGLFGLAAFTAERRIKEIGIRKALGSSSRNIVYLLSGDFTRLVLVSILLALPVSYYLIDSWLERFAFRIDMEWWYFVASGLAALLIAWLAVGGQAIKAANVNPAKCLKSE